MTEQEVAVAWDLYSGGATLSEVRNELVGLGYPSRSVNTIATRLRSAGCTMRRPGRRPAATL